jgi:hypothetical protein
LKKDTTTTHACAPPPLPAGLGWAVAVAVAVGEARQDEARCGVVGGDSISSPPVSSLTCEIL